MSKTPAKTRPPGSGIFVLYEDRDILVVDKPAGLLTVGAEKEKSRTAYHVLTNYVRKGQSRSRARIFIVHRLDRDTSGVLIFAKTEEAKVRLQSNWDDTSKTYLAVVHGQCEKDEDVVSSYLAESKAQVVFSTTDKTKGKLARTAYKTLRRVKYYSLLEIDLLTGRKNQIRVHLSDAGHPIVGDKKYGREGDAFSRLALHAKSIAFKHPTTGEPVTFSAKTPGHFAKLVGKIDEPASPEQPS